MNTPGSDYFRKLGTIVNNEVNSVADILERGGQPQPAFGTEGLSNYPREPMVRIARLKLIKALNDLTTLTYGPTELSYYKLVTETQLIFTLEALSRYKIFSLVPTGGKMTYSELSSKTGKGEDHLRRIIRNAICEHIFLPVGDDAITHSSFSLAVHQNTDLLAWIGHASEEIGKSAAFTLDAYEKHPDSNDPSHSGSGIAFGLRPGESCYSFLENSEDGEWDGVPGRGWRARRFGGAMKFLGSISGPATLSAFDWAGLGPDATLVDVGGSAGQLSLVLASRNPNLICVVQDLGKVRPVFEASIPPPFQGRITFQEHDFFKPNPIEDAAVYFLKSVLHNWSDEKSQEILQNIAPALGPKSCILLMEAVLPNDNELTVGGPEDFFFMSRKLGIAMDLHMMAIGSKERTKKQWTDLVEGSNCGLKIVNILTRPGSVASLIEIRKSS